MGQKLPYATEEMHQKSSPLGLGNLITHSLGRASQRVSQAGAFASVCLGNAAEEKKIERVRERETDV